MFVPVVLGITILLLLTRRTSMTNLTAPPVNPADWQGWVWPVPVMGGRYPVVTDNFSRTKTPKHRKHLGVDVMYPKLGTDPLGSVKHSATPNFIAPAGTPIIAPFGGRIWDAGVDSYGHWITIDHGSVGSLGGVTTRYAHLEQFARPWKRGDVVATGQRLGTMGYPPDSGLDSQQLRHLHFELRFPRAGVPQEGWVADPEPYMRYWRKTPLQEEAMV